MAKLKRRADGLIDLDNPVDLDKLDPRKSVVDAILVNFELSRILMQMKFDKIDRELKKKKKEGNDAGFRN